MKNKNPIPAGFSLDELASYLDGEKALDSFSTQEQAFLRAVDEGWLDLAEQEYTLTRTLNIRKPLSINGNNATIIGNLPPMTNDYIGGSQGVGFYVTGNQVKISDLTLKKILCAVDIDPCGKTVEHITLENITVFLCKIGFQFGSSLSNGVLRDLHFKNCRVECETSVWEHNEMAAALPFTGSAAFARENTKGDIDNCLLEDVWFEQNTIRGQARIGINLVCSLTTMELILGHPGHFHNVTLRGIHFIGNEIEKCWDVPISIVCTCHNAENGLVENVEIAENKMGHGISGLYLYAAEPLIGECRGAVVRNIEIRGNEITRVIADVGEPSRGIYIGAVRQDYYEGVIVRNALMENIRIFGNTFDGAGPNIVSVYAMLDGETYCANNLVRNVEIHDNLIKNAEYAFTFKAAELEGRRYDWNFGYPRHDQQWLPPVEDDSIPLVHVENNRIENLICENNRIEGYRYRIFAAGADCRGHGIASGNKLCTGIIFRNNIFGTGENHIRIGDYFGEDFCIDGGGNEVDPHLKNR